MKLLRYLRSVFAFVWGPFSLLLVCLVTVFVTVFFSASYKRVRKLPHWWGWFLCRVAGIKVVAHGEENLSLEQPYIFAVNHQSQLDIPVLEGYMRRDFCWMAKKELFQIPIFGRAMLANEFISVDRGQGREAMKGLLEAAKRIANGVSVVIFPEGTRSVNGKLQPFKSGALVLAIKAGVPIVPVAIRGTHESMAKGKLLPKSGNVTINIGDPIPTENLASKDKQALADLLYDKVAALLVGCEGER